MLRVRKVKGQNVLEDDLYLYIKLDQPWWGAWKQFGWEENVPGVGASRFTVELAEKLGKKIKVTYYRDRSIKYVMTPSKWQKLKEKYNSVFYGRSNVEIWVVPVNRMDRMQVIGGEHKVSEGLE